MFQFACNAFEHSVLSSPNLSDQDKKFAIQGQISLAIQELLKLLEENMLCRDDFELFSTIVCQVIHQIFIEHPECIRLVHFQGYSHHIMPVVIKKVHSLRIKMFT
jgi:hypothetical protein